MYRVWVQAYKGRYTAVAIDVTLLLETRQIYKQMHAHGLESDL